MLYSSAPPSAKKSFSAMCRRGWMLPGAWRRGSRGTASRPCSSGSASSILGWRVCSWTSGTRRARRLPDPSPGSLCVTCSWPWHCWPTLWLTVPIMTDWLFASLTSKLLSCQHLRPLGAHVVKEMSSWYSLALTRLEVVLLCREDMCSTALLLRLFGDIVPDILHALRRSW